MISLPLAGYDSTRRHSREICPRSTQCRTLRKCCSGVTAIYMKAIILVIIATYSICEAVQYANEWTVTIEGGKEMADSVARTYGFVNLRRLFEDEDVYVFTHHGVAKRSLRHSDDHHAKLMSHSAVRSVEQQAILKRVKRDSASFDPTDEHGPNDPKWPNTWYLLPSTEPSMRVTEAWEAGYSGKNVVVTILDDGIEYTHPDLAINYDKGASKDINDHDDDPKPRPTYNNENRHGTRCAGEVAAVVDNGVCSVGIAYDARIGGVRMLDGPVTDSVEAASIGLAPQHIDIYSASWGPDDDGRTVDGPAKNAKLAFKKGIEQGRGGKGSIFVWASGNGGRKHDNCNCDGYTNSIYTLSISSTTQNTNKPWYSEDCSSTLATTYSSGVSTEKQIVTTDLDAKCTTTHTGTSASAPLAAGICALALEANPKLTWRDMQHLVVKTANPDRLRANDWVTNGAGRKVSHSYGYGLMDAYAMVTEAKTWQSVPVQRKCGIVVVSDGANIGYSTGDPFVRNFTVSGCTGTLPDRLEHVQAVITASSSRRGDMLIYLKSPMGTKSTLLDARAYDARDANFNKWPFMTTHSWDEDPNGQWTLEIQTKNSRVSSSGFVDYFELVMYGTLTEDWSDGLVADTSTDDVINALLSQNSSVRQEKASDLRLHETTTIQNCQSQSDVGHLCLACHQSHILSVDRRQCFQECPKGQFLMLEKADEKVPRDESTETSWEILHEAVFEDEERFKGTKVCQWCKTGPHCLACNGPSDNQCTECSSSWILKNGHCVSSGVDTSSNNVIIMTIGFCILSVILFLLLFLFLHFYWNGHGKPCCRKDSTNTLYSYVPNDTDGKDEKFVNGGNWSNGSSAALLTAESDEDKA